MTTSVRTNVQGTIEIKMRSVDGEMKRVKVSGKFNTQKGTREDGLERERRTQ